MIITIIDGLVGTIGVIFSLYALAVLIYVIYREFATDKLSKKCKHNYNVRFACEVSFINSANPITQNLTLVMRCNNCYKEKSYTAKYADNTYVSEYPKIDTADDAVKNVYISGSLK